MKRWIKRSLLAVFGVTVAVAGLSACSHHSPAYGAHLGAEEYAQKREKMVGWASDKLDLNAEQKQKLTVLGDALYAQRTALIGQTQNPRAEFQALIAADKFDRSRAQALISDKTAVIQNQSPVVIAALADFFDSLNPVQQQKVRGYLEHRGGWFHRG